MWLNCLNVHRSKRRARSDFLDAPFISWTNSNAINQNWTHLSFSLISTDFLLSCFHGFGVARRPASADVTTTRRRKTKGPLPWRKKKPTTCAAPDRNSGWNHVASLDRKNIYLYHLYLISYFNYRDLWDLICDYIETIYETISLKVICDV